MLQKARLVSGLVLFVYVTMHLVNHMAGVISLSAMDAWRPYLTALWSTPVVTESLYLAILVHIGASLWTLASRSTLRLRPWQWAQTVLGLALPFLLLEHVLGTRAAYQIFGTAPSYPYVMAALWVIKPVSGVLQALTLLAAWGHGCIGLHYWLRLKRWYAPARPVLFALAVLVPALSLAGYLSAGIEVLELAQHQAALNAIFVDAKASTEMVVFVAEALYWGLIAMAATVLLALGVPVVRALRRRFSGPLLVYRDGRVVRLLPGATALDSIRAAGIPHAAVCGGRGRCSTCRIRIGEGADQLDPPSGTERKVLERIGAPDMVRLACQIRPTRNLEVTPMLPPTATAQEAIQAGRLRQGDERQICVLFADLRGFTKLSEGKLPYDVVFLLNRYFDSMGQIIENTGGRLDKFIGDGIMALFGLDRDAGEGARQALRAAQRMSERLVMLNEGLRADLPDPLRMAMGLHFGPAIVGEMGYGSAKGLTAVGDTVNTASRMEGLAKTFDAELVVSDDVLRAAGQTLTGAEVRSEPVRGRAVPVDIYVVANMAAASLVERAEDMVGVA